MKPPIVNKTLAITCKAPPANFKTNPVNNFKGSIITFITVNIPLNVFLRFSILVLLKIKECVNFSIDFEIDAHCSPVLRGNKSLNASFIGTITFFKASNIFLKLFIIETLPPAAAQSSIILLRASADFCIILSNDL